jgi:miniconductance mechanosensitive channel
MLEQLTLWLQAQGVLESYSSILAQIILALMLVPVIYIISLILNKIILRLVENWTRQTTTAWDDFLLKNKFFKHISHLPPAMLVYFCAGFFPEVQVWVERLSAVYMIVILLLIINAFLDSSLDIYRTYEVSKSRPIKGYIQIVKIIIAIFGAILIIATMINESPLVLLGGLSALTAVIMLVFKDTILGLVASFQLTANDMLQIGDWIEMPQFGADGDVIDITVTTVKVQNFDKTITTIPTYKLISDSFRNWRGMSESGGRRIKRTISINMTSIRFCTAEMIERFGNIPHIQEYIQEKKAEQKVHTNDMGIAPDDVDHGHHITNAGAFRAYIIAYLRTHPKIHLDMTLLVRQLAPTPNGLPFEVYAFSNDQVWSNYESIQADIFDHLLAIIPEFDLQVYQTPSGNDITTVKIIDRS